MHLEHLTRIRILIYECHAVFICFMRVLNGRMIEDIECIWRVHWASRMLMRAGGARTCHIRISNR